MINSTCGYDPQRRLTRRGGCGVWVGYEMRRPSGNLYPATATPHFHNGIAWCGNCYRGFNVKHLGQGVFVRPKEEGDDVALPELPKLEELYS